MAMDFEKLAKAAQEMQAQMQQAQEEIAHEIVEGTAGGGAVTVKATGAGKITEVKIAKQAIDPDDPETLEDLVLAGVNQALKNAQDLMQSRLGGAMGDLGGLGIPGL